MLSISGEDFYVEREGGGRAFDIVGSNKVPFGVGGFVLDKMELKAGGKLCGSIERRAVAMATAYDIYLKGDCIAKIEKDIVSLTPSYKFFYEAENNGNPCYRATGSFSQRKYDIYARDGPKSRPSAGNCWSSCPTGPTRTTSNARPASTRRRSLHLALVIDEDHDESARRATRGGKRAATTAGCRSVFSRGRWVKTLGRHVRCARAPGWLTRTHYWRPARLRREQERPAGDGPRRGHVAEASENPQRREDILEEANERALASGHVLRRVCDGEDINNDQHGVAEREA